MLKFLDDWLKEPEEVELSAAEVAKKQVQHGTATQVLDQGLEP